MGAGNLHRRIVRTEEYVPSNAPGWRRAPHVIATAEFRAAQPHVPSTAGKEYDLATG